MLEYECPNCGEILNGSFGDDIHCNNCNKTYETDYDYVDDNITCWITSEKRQK